MSTITLYSKPACVQCNAVKRLLDSHDIEYNVIDMSENPDALATVVDAGHQSAPVLVFDGNVEDGISGFNPVEIKKRLGL